MADAEALQLASLSSSTPPAPTPAASSPEPLFVDDCRGCTRLLDVRCAGYTRALMFHHKLVDCILPQYVPLMEQLEKAAQEGGTTCILSDADVMHPYLEALLPAARPRLRVRLVGNGSTHRPLALNATPGCGALPLSPVQRVQPLGLKDYVCHDCTKGCHALVSDGTLTRPLALAACTACERGRYMPSGGTCVSTFPPFKSGQLVAELRTDVRALGIQSPWRTTTTTTTLAAAAAATAVASDGVVAAALGGDGSGGGSRRQMILLVARRSTVWSNTYNGTAARSWTEESRLALRRALEAVPGAQVRFVFVAWRACHADARHAHGTPHARRADWVVVQRRSRVGLRDDMVRPPTACPLSTLARGWGGGATPTTGKYLRLSPWETSIYSPLRAPLRRWRS